MRDKQQQKLCELLSHRSLSPKELMQGLNISQPTLSRLIQSMNDEIIVMGKGRATQYGLPRHIHQRLNKIPIYAIDPRGDAKPSGVLTVLQGGQFWFENEDGTGELFSQLPWFLEDLLMTGYCGRAFVSHHCKDLQLPNRLSDWGSDNRLFAATQFGDDPVGNLIIGEASLARYFGKARRTINTIELDDQSWIYPQSAQKVLAGGYEAPLLGGNQPKFTVCLNDHGMACHMLVKFSPAVDSNEARRYADLLICEHLALETIRSVGYNSARSRIVPSGYSVFLTLKRFDRRGPIGRLPVISLRSLHTRISSPCDNWVNASVRLEKRDLIRPQEAQKLRWLSVFSDLIGNTNQHFQNISLIPHQQDNYILAPIYGIRPTLYEPVAGEIPQRLFTPPPVPNEAEKEIDSALKAAILFWKSAAVDERISQDFRQICYENCELLQLQQKGPRLIR